MGQDGEAEGSICWPFLGGILSLDWSWFLSKERWLRNLGSLTPSVCISSCSLMKCDLEASAYQELASLLLSSKNLKKLTLSKNALSRDGMEVFCDALFHPNCVLESLV